MTNTVTPTPEKAVPEVKTDAPVDAPAAKPEQTQTPSKT